MMFVGSSGCRVYGIVLRAEQEESRESLLCEKATHHRRDNNNENMGFVARMTTTDVNQNYSGCHADMSQ